MASGTTTKGLGADLGVNGARAATKQTGLELSVARRRWMEAESAYRAAATRELAIDEDPVEALHQLRELAKAAEDAYCEALAASEPLLTSR